MTDSPTRRSADAGARRSAAAARERSAARLAAVQALYQIEMTGAPSGDVLREFLNLRLGEDVDGLDLAHADRRLLDDLVTGVTAQHDELDDLLAAVLDEDWPVERLETLVRLVLRSGAYELAERRKTPVRVILAEYVGLADAFFSGKEPGLVNGVLDRLARSLRPEEFETEPPRGPDRSGP